MRGRAGADEGSILPLIFGFFAIALALILVATAATSLYLERSRLYTLADAGVREAASAYLAAAAAGRNTTVALVAASAPDGRSAVVRLAEIWRPPFVGVFLPSGVRIEVEADARPVFW